MIALNTHLSIIVLRELDLEMIKANILTKVHNDYDNDKVYLVIYASDTMLHSDLMSCCKGSNASVKMCLYSVLTIFQIDLFLVQKDS